MANAPKKAKKAKNAKSRGGHEPVAVLVETEVPPSEEERAQSRVNNAVRALVPELDAQIADLDRRLSEAENQIKAIGNSIHKPPEVVVKSADKYFHKGPKSIDRRTTA